MSFNIPVALAILALWCPCMRYFIVYLIIYNHESRINLTIQRTWVTVLVFAMLIGILVPGMIISIYMGSVSVIDSKYDPSLLHMLIITIGVNIYCIVQAVKYKEVRNKAVSTLGVFFPVFTTAIDMICYLLDNVR